MKYKGFIKVALIFASVLILGLPYLCQAKNWRTCIRTSIGAANRIAILGILTVVPCPPGVSGTCWRTGPNWSQFTFGNQNRTGPCSEATYPASRCSDGQGAIEICGVSAVFLQGPSFEYIHSSQPPTVLYIKAATGLTPNISGIWQSRHGMVYEIIQNGNDFTWNCVTPKTETATGAILGSELRATWQNAAGTASADGEVTQTDAQNNATEITWTNGAVFFR